jgi:uncharacterized protein YvpB
MPGSRIWNVLGLLLIGLTLLAALFTAWLFTYPQSRLNPFPVRSAPQAEPAPGVALAAALPGEAQPPASPLRYPTLPPEWTRTPVPPATITRTPRPTRTPSPTLTPSLTGASSPTLTPTPTLLTEARVTGVIGHRQKWSLSCEARSASDWAAYFGLTIDEVEFLSRLPLSDNPEAGFVGDVNADWGYLPPQGYGVHAGPVAELLRGYGANAQAQRDLRWEDLQKEIIAGRPVIAWIVGHLWEGKAATYTAQDGQTVTVARYEHTVILTGYTSTRVTVVDGENIYSRPLAGFLDSWSVLGNMAIFWVQ